ncbi:TonB-dependent receptor domain-containing protein [Sphingobium nicotianae]|uniref:TonB-dependent receptor n=1 Tax=Sphingobium nicotianae TaxID=2782607 RepID=A0A9X1D993_9SPHN|nr:TonB-dependent receptor [Sphingobium nicotianae]MBT2185403.1 TonB-dependent receptor [Sphingobium nicotianae]
MSLSASAVACAWVTALPQAAFAQETAGAAAEQAGEAGTAGDEAIVVTGSRLAGGFKAPTPVTVLGEDRITALAATNLGDVMNRLPAFRMATAPTTALSSTGSGGNLGARYLDLRGLGASRTLLLVDGKRFVPSSILGSVDANLIPALLVKRVEIVTGGASAAYGSDAVAGVVNIILDSKLDGFRAQVQAGTSQIGDANTRQASLAAGTGFAGGRGHIVVAGEWSDDGAAGGCYTRDWCSAEWGIFQNTAFRTNGLPASIWTPGVRAATMTQTGIINSPNALRGITFNPDGSVRATPFQYGATPGVETMIGGEGYGSNWRLAVPYLKIPVQRYSLFANLEYDVTDSIKAVVTASYGQSEAQNRGAALFERALTINAANPFIPAPLKAQLAANNVSSFVFGRLGSFILGSQDIDPTAARGKATTFRIASGLQGSLGGSWRWDAYYQYGASDYRVNSYNIKNLANFPLALDAVMGPNGPMCRSTLTNPTNGCVPLNLFGSGNFSQAAFNYAFGSPWQTQKLRQHVAAVNIRGNLVDLWAGPLAVAAGLEYRRDTTKTDADAIGQALGWQYGNGARYSGRIITKEGYVEGLLPLAKDMSFAKLIELNAAARVTDYSTSGTVTTWKAGLVYEPIDGIRFRVTRSRDIRAPNAQELFNPGGATPGNVVDRRTNISTIARVRTGGNPNLVPEIAKTWTAGVVLTPGGEGILKPLRLSVDWFDISLNGAISTISAQTIVDRCQLQNATDYCSLITQGPDNVITEVRAFSLNLNQLIARGVDAELAYRVQLGSKSSVDFNILGTYNKDLITVDSVGAINRAGQTGMQNLGATGIPRWSVTSTTTIQTGPVKTTIENRYIPKGIYDPTLIGPEDAGYANTLTNSISTNRVSGRFYTNLGISVAVESGARTQFELYGFVGNLFNQDPPISPGSTSTNPALFDTIGRSFQAGVRVRH